MKIWFDLTNSPQVNFFAGMIKNLSDEHDVIITSRHYNNTIELLELFRIIHHTIGKHPGKNKTKKVFAFINRILKVYFYLRKKNIDAAISHSSFFSPIVSKMLGIRVIYLNDNEHAFGNRISFIFANKIMIPEFLDTKKIYIQWGNSKKIIKYPGVKEGIYLWNYKQSQSGKNNLEISYKENQKVIFVRPEPWMAQYYRGKKNFMDTLLMELKDAFKVVLLPRGEIQKKYYQQKKFSGIHIPHKSVMLTEIIEKCCTLFNAFLVNKFSLDINSRMLCCGP
jgi:predicted glycosyltransferase